MQKNTIKVGLIGFGARGVGMLSEVLAPMAKTDLELAAVCDLYEDRARYAADFINKTIGYEPFCTTDYREVVNLETIDAVIIMSAWESHVPIALAAMRAGKYVAVEAGGAYSLSACWDLVNTSELTGMPCMLLENCCYSRREMMVLNMVRQGVLGDIVHCSGGYHHDLRSEIANGKENRHYRLRNYLKRNCENYPTHELGPIAKILNINNGNRFLTLTSTASCAKGLHEYVLREKGTDSPLASAAFAQGDVVTTVIKCAGGETITLTLDTTLPRSYSRGFTIQGTKGFYAEDTDSVFLDGVHNDSEFDWKKQWGNAESFAEQYDHPLWKDSNDLIIGGHGGIDGLVMGAFIESVKSGTQPPITVYDMAALMSISALSEESISLGSQPVAIPDFTGGRWIEHRDNEMNLFQI